MRWRIIKSRGEAKRTRVVSACARLATPLRFYFDDVRVRRIVVNIAHAGQ